MRIISLDPQDLLLQPEDLPKEGKYFLPNTYWIGRTTNAEMVSSWGADEGRTYLQETGRIEGWFVTYSRGTRTVKMPEEVWANAVMYQTAEGAALTITKYGSHGMEEWEELDPIDLGDVSRTYYREKMQPSGVPRVSYRVTFAYRNYIQTVECWGWKDEVTLEFAELVARVLLDKLRAAPLAEPALPAQSP